MRLCIRTNDGSGILFLASLARKRYSVQRDPTGRAQIYKSKKSRIIIFSANLLRQINLLHYAFFNLGIQHQNNYKSAETRERHSY